jgi:hypothetical protein
MNLVHTFFRQIGLSRQCRIFLQFCYNILFLRVLFFIFFVNKTNTKLLRVSLHFSVHTKKLMTIKIRKLISSKFTFWSQNRLKHTHSAYRQNNILYEIHWDPCPRIFGTYYFIYRQCVHNQLSMYSQCL